MYFDSNLFYSSKPIIIMKKTVTFENKMSIVSGVRIVSRVI